LKDYEGPEIPISLVYPKRELLPAKSRLFIDFVKQELRAWTCQ
jgi:DNA-binding transcriptional LysR family regulator